MNKITVETQQPPNPTQGGDPIVPITRLKIAWYTEYQKGAVTSFLEIPNENNDFSERLFVLSSTDYVYYAIDFIANVEGRAHTEDANKIINAKAPGLANYLKGRISLSTSVAGFTPTDIFYAFGTWINTTSREQTLLL